MLIVQRDIYFDNTVGWCCVVAVCKEEQVTV